MKYHVDVNGSLAVFATATEATRYAERYARMGWKVTLRHGSTVVACYNH